MDSSWLPARVRSYTGLYEQMWVGACISRALHECMYQQINSKSAQATFLYKDTSWSTHLEVPPQVPHPIWHRSEVPVAEVKAPSITGYGELDVQGTGVLFGGQGKCSDGSATWWSASMPHLTNIVCIVCIVGCGVATQTAMVGHSFLGTVPPFLNTSAARFCQALCCVESAVPMRFVSDGWLSGRGCCFVASMISLTNAKPTATPTMPATIPYIQ